MKNYEDMSEEERRALRTATFDFMICLQLEDQFDDDEGEWINDG